MEGVAMRMGERVDELDDLVPAHCANVYLDTWDRHQSIAFSNTKGLRNAPGENNCFVNCAVQVFWHLDVFRRSYRRLSGHTCMGNSCIFCALKVIFTQFQYSDKASLQPDALRKALAQTFANQQRFQLGHMDDAAECFENILRRLHFHVASSFNEDSCTAAHCLPHQKFSMAVQEKVVCVCGASTNPLKFHEMVHYVSASALLAQARQDHGGEGVTHPDHFGLLLRRASAMGDVRNCPASCGKQVQKQRTLLNIPDVVSVGLVWDSDRPTVETTTEVAKILGTSIHLPEMYHHVKADPIKLPVLQLVAVVCYYGKHYSTFVFHSKLKTWIYFDDATVREIGPRWSNVVDKCSRGRFQPLLLLYANDNAAPIAVDTAPQRRVMATGYMSGPSDTGDSRLDRTHESIKSFSTSSRQSTPNPDHAQNMGRMPAPLSPEETGRDSPASISRDHIRQPSFLSAVSKERARPSDTAEGVGTLPGGAAYKPSGRRQLLDGGANCGPLKPTVEECVDYPDYTLSSGGQYRRPSPLGVESKRPLPMPPNVSRGADDQRKAAWMKTACGKEKVGVDVVRCQVDASRSHRGTPDFTVQPSCNEAQREGLYRTAGPPGTERALPGREEGSRGVWAGSQHVVVKPTPTARAQQDPADYPSSHTPVQSGLATLPRPKGHHRNNEPSSHRQSSPANQEVTQLTHRSSHSGSPRNCPLPPGTPPPEYDSVVGSSQQAHSRQASTCSQASSMRSSVSMGNLHQLGSGKLLLADNQQSRTTRNEIISREDVLRGHGKPTTTMKKSESESAALRETFRQYIDPRMVENILKHQGVTRSGSSCSNSSVESDSLMGKLVSKQAAGTALKVDIPLDNLSLSSMKDSGCGSCDRHSSSSTGSGSVDHLPQYLFNKSMIVPRSINMPHCAADQHTPHCPGGPGDSHRNSPRTVQGGAHPESGQPKVMQSIKESSQEDVLKAAPNEPLGTKKFIMAAPATSHPAEPRPPPIPPKNLAQYQIIKSSHGQPSSTPHEKRSSLENLIKEENVSSNVVKLCKKANQLMDKCVMAENKEDVSSALQCGEGALEFLQEAMAHKELNSKARAYLQKKHSTCLLKVHTLQTRAPASRQESHSSGIGSDITSSVGNSRSSITSSDSDLSDQVLRHSRPAGRSTAPPLPRPHLPPHPSHVASSDPARDTRGPGTVPVPRGHSGDNKNGYHHTVSQRDLPGGYPGNAAHGRPGAGSPSDVCRQSKNRTDSCSSSRVPNGHGRSDSCSSSHVPHDHSRSDSCSSNAVVSRDHSRSDSCSSSSHLPQGHDRTNVSSGVVCPPASSAVSDYVTMNSIGAGDSTADLYGTLPRNKSRKPGSDTAASAEMYQSFLNKQKSLQAAATLSQQSMDSARSDGSSDAGSKMNKTQIRQLLQHSIVQRQWHQPGSGQQNPPGQLSTAGHSSQQQEYRPSGEPCRGPGVGAGTSAYHPQPAQSAGQQRQTQAPQSGYTVPTSQHRQRPPPPAGHPPPHTAGQSRPAVPGLRPPTPGSVSAGRPRTPTCQTSAGAGCSNPPPIHTSTVPSHGSSGAAKTSAPQNVARVTPYSHLVDSQPMRCSGSSYLVMMHPSQHSSSAARGSQGHPSSGAARPFTPASKPLERSASHSDCRTLGHGASSTNVSDQGACLSNTVCNKYHTASVSVANACEQRADSHRRAQTCTPVSEGADTAAAQTPCNVRSLLSRFERTDVAPSPTSCPRPGPLHPQGQPLKREPRDRASGRASLRRTRSKSESSSCKPKSVLKKTRMKSRPRKSVTFAESIAHFAECDDANSGYESAAEASWSQRPVDGRLNFSDDDVRLSQDCDLDDSSSSSSDDDNVEEEEVCHLCRRRRSSPGQAFCAKCSYYLAKLNLS